jgi:hypothetical protein
MSSEIVTVKKKLQEVGYVDTGKGYMERVIPLEAVNSVLPKIAKGRTHYEGDELQAFNFLFYQSTLLGRPLGEDDIPKEHLSIRFHFQPCYTEFFFDGKTQTINWGRVEKVLGKKVTL